MSRNSSRSSRSRPSSLVLTNTNTNTNTGSELQTVEDASPLGGTVGAEARAVISPWAEPGEVAPFWGGVERSVTPARLGVLPSPGAETFEIILESPTGTADPLGEAEGKEATAEEVSAAEGSAKETKVEDTQTENVSQGDATENVALKNDEDVGEHNHSGINAAAKDVATDDVQRPSTPRIQVPTREECEEDEDDDELYNTTPKKVSPTSMRKQGENDQNEESTPVTPRQPQESHPVQEGSRDIAGAQNSDIEQSTPGAHEDAEAGAGTVVENAMLLASQVTGLGEETESTATTSRPESVSPSVRPEDNLVKSTAPIDSEAQGWDKRSGVSSHNEFDDTNEESNANESPSRRSSVSSLGRADHDEPVMSAQAVPAGPFIESENSSAAREERSLTRPYQYGAEGERTRSYVTLDRDSSGALVQESLDTASGLQTRSIEPSGIRGPPRDVPPFQQRRVLRDSSADATPKRYSGMIKGRKPTLTSPTAAPASVPASTPAPSAIPDHSRLEGSQDDTANVVVGEIPPSRAQQQDESQDKQSKRRSGLWDAFKSSPSASKTENSRESTSRPLDSEQNPTVPVAAIERQTREDTTRPSTLRKPQRASTTTNEPEQKKKRFSGLGSLFGRSSTTGHKTEKQKKLSKAQSSSREGSQIQNTAPSTGYDEYEATRRQHVPNFSQRQPHTYPPPSIGPPSQQYLESERGAMTSPEDMGMTPPLGGWYAPVEDQQPVLPRVEEQQPPQYRRLHNVGGRRDPPLTNVPEAFRPVDSSFTRPVMAVGPPLDDPMPGRFAPPTSPISPNTPSQRTPYPVQSGDAQPPTYGGPEQRHSSYGSSESQISGQSEWQRSDWRHRGSSASISPIQTRTGYEDFPAGRSLRIGSIHEEIARSPARDYADQQTPWSITLPQGVRASQSSSLGMQDGGRPPQGNIYPYSGHNGGFPQSDMYQTQRGLPVSPETPGSFYPAMQPRQLPPLMANAPTYGDAQARNVMPPRGNGYQSPPYTPQSPQSPSSSNRPYRRKGWPPRGKFYAQSEYNPEATPIPPMTRNDPQRQFSNNDRPPVTQRGTPGYAVYREEPAPREETPEMRGVSYPGQEWVPEPWE